MSYLHVMNEADVVESFPLNGGEFLVGREEYCDIRLSYPGISRKHMRLLTVMDDTFLEDLASKNGTYVNGRLAKKCALSDGDIIQIGELELRYEKKEAANDIAQPDDPDATTVIKPGQFGPQSRAARQSGAVVDGISPVADRVAKAQQMAQPEVTVNQETAPVGLWQKLKSWLGL